ncbi:MAG: diacylglycerol kinase family lipid kinase [Solirubrobacteraceae bacterium]|nr:diacylglycerol kinase family lipid kinase [Solirubrobacteraceae bacterium]
MDRPVVLLVNPSAGGGRALASAPAVAAAFREHGVAVRTVETTSLDHACELAAAACDAGEAVATLSGDGMIGAVAGAIRGRDDALLVALPGGRGNDFVRVLGLPRDPVAAVQALVGGVVRALDLGDVEGRAFIGIASLGFDSHANRLANEAPKRLGQLAYVYGALRGLAQHRPGTFTLTFDDGEVLSRRAFSVAAANSKAYGGGMYLAPNAELDDGLLDVVIIGDVSRLKFVRWLPKVFRGEHVGLPDVDVRQVRSVRVEADPEFELYADGDPIGTTPVTISCVPNAVPVLCPAP